jgi:beta-lactamase class A
VAGVPAGISVANKFGERELADGTRQLHDCGIVYHPERPYVLCVMTKGASFEQLSRTVADVSQLVYREIDTEPAQAFSGLR